MQTTIVVTRPAKQEDLVHELQRLSLPVLHMPLLVIEPHRYVLPSQACDLAIFTSPNAVRHSSCIHQQLIDNDSVDVCAIGTGTQQQLKAAGFSEIHVPKAQFNSEALLALPQLQRIQGKSIYLVKGVGGRPLLADVLRQKGGDVAEIECYQRQLATLPVTLLKHISTQSTIVVVSSVEALEHLAKQLVQVVGLALSSAEQPFSLVVSSQRMVQKANEFGFKNCFIAADATTQGLVAGVVRAIKQS